MVRLFSVCFRIPRGWFDLKSGSRPPASGALWIRRVPGRRASDEWEFPCICCPPPPEPYEFIGFQCLSAAAKRWFCKPGSCKTRSSICVGKVPGRIFCFFGAAPGPGMAGNGFSAKNDAEFGGRDRNPWPGNPFRGRAKS